MKAVKWCVYLSMIMFCGPRLQTLRTWRDVGRDLVALEAANDGIRRQTAELEDSVRRTERSAQYREHLVRDELGYMRRDEIAIILP